MMSPADFSAADLEDVYVVFADETSLWWLRFLKKGFRHCYLLFPLAEGRVWLEVNPFSNRTLFRLHRYGRAFNLAASLRGKTVVRGKIAPAPLKCAPLGFFTCVEFVKRTLGIHSFFIITPWQLFKKIKVVGKKS